MLKTILKRLNGHAAEAPSLNEALEQVGRDRSDTEAELARLNAERKQLLLDDAADATLDKVERQIDRANVRLEKINLAEVPLREALAAATAAERSRRWTAHLAAHRQAAAEFLAAARAVIEKHAAVVAIMNGARREGFEKLMAGAMPATPNIGGNPVCAPAALDEFERALSPVPRPSGRAPRGGIRWYAGQPGSEFYDPTRTPGPAKPTLQHAVVMEPGGGPDLAMGRGRMTAPRLPDDEGPLGDGEVRVTVLRSGFQAPDGLSHAGRRIRLPRDRALQAARAGALEIVEDPARDEAERLSENTFHPIGSIADAHQDPTITSGRSS